ncbi:type III pantothenate kinase [Salinimonas marina]|uniref:Type III pantothenate kinase n=1 Tax=Salinimonas marina TaxID=2785918 RepID=A0A7S9DY56_9ALTE|nr:type III pantothenate kinase [Salinimonas marina]QPG06038.1 type III pantothenate kinase [Salinimonas marina]
MVTEKSVLLVDAGNTQLKYVSLAQYKKHIFCADSAASLFNVLSEDPLPTHIFLCNVGKALIETHFIEFCQQSRIELHIIRTEECRFGLQNSYINVSKMGSDRWLAMIAAQEMTTQPYAVIDIGTALTCDFVEDGQHLGGWIVPGFALMQKSLVENTSKVSIDSRIPSDFGVGQDTEICVAMGCQAAVRGVYLSAVDYLSSKQSSFSIIIGGGGKNMLAFAESDGSILVANLVVHGLARYARSLLPALVSDR